MYSRTKRFSITVLSLLLSLLLIGESVAFATTQPAPDRKQGEGPYDLLIIKGATMIDGTGAPPEGPVDIVIEGNRIKEVALRGLREEPPANAKIIDATGMYVMPGFVDTHAHIASSSVNEVSAEYVYKLWLAHGVTTIRDPGSFIGLDWTLNEKKRSEENEIVAPRIYSYVIPGAGWHKPILTPEDAREYVRWAKKKGVDGFKIRRWDPPIMEALLDEAKKQNLGTAAHLEQTIVSQTNGLDAARMGLGSLDHWYGLPEALFDDRSIQDYPYDYNYSNEYDRFSQAGRLWEQAAPPGSAKWNAVLNEMLDLDLTLSPTMTIYEATRDLMRVKNEDWHDEYTHPALWEFYQPNPKNHGSFFFDWTTADEVEWKNNFNLWMAFLNEYKNRGGRVTVGSDSGFIYRTFGFGYIRELELLQEAGFHPLEVIQAATMNGAELLAKENGKPMEFGVIRPGMLADLVLVEVNPLNNFKTLYGIGAIKLNVDEDRIESIGGVSYTIKDGIVYDAKELLADVKKIVEEAKQAKK